MNARTPIADMIAEMHASGIQLDMIIVAVRSMERAMSTRHPVDEVAEKRRAWDRQYRRNKRLPRPPDQPDIHPNPPDVGDIALSSLEKKDSYSEVVNKKEKKERGHKLPPDWKPNRHHYDEGACRGMSFADVDERATRMREWCDANANRSITTKANWDAAFMGAWLKQENNRNGQRTGNTRTTGHDAILAAATREARKIPGDGAMAGSADEAEFPFRHEPERGSAGLNSRTNGHADPHHDGRKPQASGVLEGEVIAPDKAAAGVSSRGLGH